MTKKEIAYKVVEKRTRLGLNVARYRTDCFPGQPEEDRRAREIKLLTKAYPAYFPHYSKNHLISAPPLTAGIFIFTTKEDAKYVKKMFDSLPLTIIKIRILDLTTLTPRKYIFSSAWSDPRVVTDQKWTNSSSFSNNLVESITNTYTVNGIEVLD